MFLLVSKLMLINFQCSGFLCRPIPTARLLTFQLSFQQVQVRRNADTRCLIKRANFPIKLRRPARLWSARKMNINYRYYLFTHDLCVASSPHETSQSRDDVRKCHVMQNQISFISLKQTFIHGKMILFSRFARNFSSRWVFSTWKNVF